MGSRRGAAVAAVVVVGLLVAGVALTVAGATLLLRHVPRRAMLVVDVAGSLADPGPEGPVAELFSPRRVTRQGLLEGLARAVSDPRIRAVRLRVGDVGAGFATVQEIRSLLGKLTVAGKDTAAYLDTVGEFAPANREYLLASACRRIVVGPLATVNLTGLSARVPFLRGTLDKLGIEPEFPGIGEFKTARFFYTEKDLTAEDREMTGWLLASLRDQLVEQIAASRGLEPARVRELVAQAPLTAEAALAAGLVDEIADWQGFVDHSPAGGAERLEEVSLGRYLRAQASVPGAPVVAVVSVRGAIVRGESGFSPLPVVGGEMAGADTVAEALRAVRDSEAVAAVLRIDSPGGSAVAAETIRAEVVRTAKQMPVVVSMGDVAASGGYWIACGATRLFASPATLTGSIGVYAGHLAMARFWEEKLGVSWGRVEGDPNADIFASLDPWTPPQRAAVERLLQTVYDSFVERVAAARRMSREAVEAVGRGRVFTGAQAVEKGLVDELGGFEEALAAAKELAGLDRDQPVQLAFYPRFPSLWERVVQRLVEDREVDALLRALAAGRLAPPGVVWMPPIALE
jgi:protease-4